MIRVLIVEDSPTSRALLAAILRSDPEIEVVGEAVDGVEGVRMAKALRPDLLTMDVEMPRLNGLEATREIMISAPTPIVIVTANTRRGEAEASMAMLRTGALDVLEKPVSPASPEFDAMARRLIWTVKAMAQVKVIRHWRAASRSDLDRPASTEHTRGRVVAVAASTGGPAALHRLLCDLPGDFPAPILAVQHIATGFIDGFANWLNSASAFRVKPAQDREPLVPGTVYLAPDDRQLGVSGRGLIALSDAPAVGGFRPSATHLFESVARDFGASALAVILTGMGEDGVAGLRSVRQAGGRVIAQDERTSVVYGMPGAAVEAGLADAVLPIEAIAARLIAMV